MKYLKFNEEKGTILIKNVRLSYPHLFEKWSGDDEDESKGRYSGKFLLDKQTHAEEIKTLRQHVIALQKEWFKGKIGSDRLFLRDGDDTGKEEQEGMWVVSAGDPKRRPQVVNKDKSPVTEEDDIVYGGCVVHVVIRLWKQEHPKYGKRINANLIGVQYHAKGERFGEEPIDASDEFEDEDDFDEQESRKPSKSKAKTKSRSDDDDLDGDDDFD